MTISPSTVSVGLPSKISCAFEKQYQGCRVIRLEQNYRSTQNILGAANAVIRNNQGRKGKELWTDKAGGEKLKQYTAMNENDEAQYVAAQILAGYSQGRQWKEHAVLYRMNAQSNQIENAFKRNGIPYRIFGGTRFFDRAEIKDMVAYLCVLNNPADDLRLQRIINNPPRGIGQTTVQRAQAIAAADHLSLWEVVRSARNYPDLQKAAPRLAQFTDMMEELSLLAGQLELPDFYEELLARTGYAVMLEAKNTVEDRTRLENVRELLTSIKGYLENADEEPSLAGFLDEIALYTDLDNKDDSENCVVMMTMHSAKGLEFPVVFVVGAEEGIFPGVRAIGEPEEMEEERRLCYVAMTRAKEVLHMTCASQRMLFGRTSSNLPSRFLEEIPEEYLERSGRANRLPADDAAGFWAGAGEGGYRRGRADGISPYGVRRTAAAEGRHNGAEGRREGIGVGYFLGKSPAVPGSASRPAGRAGGAPSLQAGDWHKGDMVEHKAFGRGMVLSIQPMGGDALIEIAFDQVGTKRLMLKSASQHMKKAGQ